MCVSDGSALCQLPEFPSRVVVGVDGAGAALRTCVERGFGVSKKKATNKKIVRERSSRDRVCKRVPRDSDRPRVNSKTAQTALIGAGAAPRWVLLLGTGPVARKKAAAPTFRSL